MIRQKGMIRGILVIATSFGMTLGAAQPISDTPTEAWVARYNGPANGEDSAESLTVDKIGNVYVTGNSDGDGYATIKYDSAGNQIWVARYSGSSKDSSDRAYSLAVDEVGNVYVTGESRGDGTGSDYATIKYDSVGNQIWVARYSGSSKDSSDRAYSLAVDEVGNVYVTGASSDDYVTIKYDNAGNELWVARYDGPASGWDYAHSLALDGAGNVYVTGNSDGNVTIKYDSVGNELWVARYSGASSNSLAVDEAGNAYVTGQSFDDGTGSDYATIKYDSAGNELWVAHYNGSANKNDIGTSLAVDKFGNVYVTGWSEVGRSSNRDYATIKYDSMGNELWVARYNGPGSNLDRAYSLTVDDAGNVYVTGHSDGDGTGLDYATIKYVQQPSGAEPRPTITANGSTEALTIAQGTPIKVRISLDPGNQLFKKADWWIAYLGPSGLHCLTLRAGWALCNEQVIPTVSIPLLKIPSVQIFSDASLPVGAYAFLMGVDMNMNGQLDGDSLYYDLVVVNIEDQ